MSPATFCAFAALGNLICSLTAGFAAFAFTYFNKRKQAEIMLIIANGFLLTSLLLLVVLFLTPTIASLRRY